MRTEVLKGRGVSSCGVAIVLSLALFCVSSTFAFTDSQTFVPFHNNAENAAPLSYETCQRSDEIVLTNEKTKRGPFGDVKQMERVRMLEIVLENAIHKLEKAGICYWAERDTLLAASKHGMTFPYSEHLDLAITSKSYARALKALKSLDSEVGTITVEEEEDKGRILVRFTKLGLEALLKINTYTPSGNRLETLSSPFRPAVGSIFPLKKALFNGRFIAVPARSERYLSGQFGPYFVQREKVFDWQTMSYVRDALLEDNFPLVSVIIPTYGRHVFLRKTLEFVKRQDYPNLEIIIVDDSEVADNTIIEGQDARFQYYHLPSRKSIGVKRNIAVEKAKGAIIVHWDDDDYFREHRITQQVAPIIRGEVDMTVLEHHLYFHLPSKSFYHVKRASTWGPHFATFVYNKKIWDSGIRYPDNSMAEDYAFAETALTAGFKINVQNNEDGKHIYVRHSNTWEFELDDYASQVQKVDRPEFFSERDETFFLNIEIKPLNKPPKHYAAATIQWNRPELMPQWSFGVDYPPYYPPYYPKYPSYNDDDVFDATWIFVGVAGGLPIVVAVLLGVYYLFTKRSRSSYSQIGDDGGLSSVA